MTQNNENGTHTPGPWRYEGDGWVAVDDADNQDANGHCVPVCNVRGAQAHQIDANGRLIAASPALLEALYIIAGGHTTRFPNAPDVMTESAETFQHKMWGWSQEVARDAIKFTQEN